MTEPRLGFRSVSDVVTDRPTRWILVGVAALALCAGAAAPAAAATVRNVAVGGVAEGDCTVDPCALAYAVEIAASGDEIAVAPGEYAGGMTVLSDRTLRGIPGQPRPVLTSNEVGYTVTLSAGSALRHVEVRTSADGGIDATGALVEDVVVRGLAPLGVALHAGASLVSSTIWMEQGASAAVRVTMAAAETPAAVRHVTAYAGQPGSRALVVDALGGAAHAVVTNSILRGADDGADIEALEVSDDAAVTTSHSNYRATHVDLAPGATHGTEADQTATDPVLADPAAGDFHQLTSSPTIDAGVSDPLVPLSDIDGDTRPLGLAADIGADERVPPEVVDPVITATPTPVVETQPLAPALEIQQITVTGNAATGRTMTIRARDPDAPLNGVFVDFGNGLVFAESACRTLPGAVFDPGRSVEFAVPVPKAAAATASVQVLSGGCGVQQSAQQQVSLTPAAAAAGTAAPTAIAAAAGCRGATALPRAGGEKRAIATVLCLLNRIRRAARLKPLKRSPKLARAARIHNSDMLARRFYAHEQPPGPALPARLKKAKWRGRGAGENLGLASLTMATPNAMVAAWMKSPPHRANILSRTFRYIGVAMHARDPLGRLPKPAIYTLDFGTSR